METRRVIAILLIVGGALGLAYGGFSYTRETHRADVGPIHLSFDEKERVNIPIWAGIGALLLGGVLLLGRGKA